MAPVDPPPDPADAPAATPLPPAPLPVATTPTPRRARPWAVGVTLAALFGCGVLVGALGAIGALHRETQQRLDPERWPAAIMGRLDRELKLSPSQHEAIAPLVRAGTTEVREARRRAMTELWSILERSHAQVADQLNPDQRRALDQLINRRQQAARWWFRPRHGAGEHPMHGDRPPPPDGAVPPHPPKSL